MTPRFTVLVCSVYSRTPALTGLLDKLAPQLLPYAGQASILLDRDDGEAPVGVKRTRLLKAARAGWTAFVDDDDEVSGDYIASIMAALDHDPDQVGFQVTYTEAARMMKPAFHTIHAGGWREDDNGYWRDISHLNPLRRTIALRGLPFLDGFGEDCAWATKIRETGLVRTEVTVPRALYWYKHSPVSSLFGGGKRTLGYDPGLASYPFVSVLAGT